MSKEVDKMIGSLMLQFYVKQTVKFKLNNNLGNFLILNFLCGITILVELFLLTAGVNMLICNMVVNNVIETTTTLITEETDVLSYYILDVSSEYIDKEVLTSVESKLTTENKDLVVKYRDMIYSSTLILKKYSYTVICLILSLGYLIAALRYRTVDYKTFKIMDLLGSLNLIIAAVWYVAIP